MVELYPSLLAADQKNLIQMAQKLEAHCPGFHIDIMDNKFVPNRGISVENANDVAKVTVKPSWVHLMVENPQEYINILQVKPGSIVTFHIESHKDTRGLISEIIEKKWKPGIAVNPKTGIDEIFPFLDSLHQVLIMSVEPGFAGQEFVPSVVEKIAPLVGFRATKKLDFKIAMDGGIQEKNIRMLCQKQIDQIVLGTALFDTEVGAAKALEFYTKIVSAMSRTHGE